MMDYIRRIALLLPEVTEEPHFQKVSFRIRKKIFATYIPGANEVVFKLSPAEQQVFCQAMPDRITVITGSWGRQGWTKVRLQEIDKPLLKDMILVAYCCVAPVKLAARVNDMRDQ